MLSQLPPELSAHVAQYLTLSDALALSLTRRDTPVAACEVLDGERSARAHIMACAESADLVRRVGMRRLCRAWKLDDGFRPYAALRSQLERRLRHLAALTLRVDADAAPTADVRAPTAGVRAPTADDDAPFGLATCDAPFGLATCDAPGSVLFVYGWPGSNRGALLRAVAAVAFGATGRRATVLHRPIDQATIDRGRPYDVVIDRRWDGVGRYSDVPWDELDGGPRFLVADGLYNVHSSHMRALRNMARLGFPGDDAVAVTWDCPFPHEDEIAIVTRARTVAIPHTHVASPSEPQEPIWFTFYHLRPPPTEAETGELLRLLASLRAGQWLIIDGWLRRWQVWSPPNM